MPKPNKIAPPATTQDFPIVGIGASAGGLEAFRRLLVNIPPDSGMAYVLVQHLDPTHNSILTELLSKVTSLPVNEITDDIHLAPNHIYVIPENKLLTSIDGVLKINPRDNKTKNVAIDVFFKSLAEVHLNMAVGIILSGNGKDGTEGLRVIKEHGGITFAQEIATALNKEMPQNAIDAGVIDHILPPDEIPQKLVAILLATPVDKGSDGYDEVVRLVSSHSGVDFTYYKQSTIRRRIMRRMSISKVFSMKEYLKLLESDKTAPQTLLNDLLIPVTEFFRDPQIFKSVSDLIFPLLMQRLTETNSIKIWVAGCSTGEEAYSLAIALHEYLGANKKGIQIQVFASDISELAIAKARIGFYKKLQLKNVPETLLTKYFTGNTNGYKIKPEIRDLCVFAVHNFLKDPPFAKIDLLTCRNVLIYMDAQLQKKALTTFHYALKKTGFLLLGKSETAGPAAELFSPLEKAGKIYTPYTVPQKSALSKVGPGTLFTSLAPGKPIETINSNDFKKSAEMLLLSKHTPTAIVVNENMDIVHMHGSVGDFVELSQGKPTFNLLKLCREGLVFELRNTFNVAQQTMLPASKEGIQLKSDKEIIEVSIEIQPLPDTDEQYFLVLFTKTRLPTIDTEFSGLTKAEILDDRKLKRIAELERELARMYGDVMAVTEQQSRVNEVLQSANEELLSGSEELQSLNEELETSKEELQSTNEELTQINGELLNKQEQINLAKNYTEAIIATLREPIVVLDTKLSIRNINRAFAKKYDITKLEAKSKLIFDVQNHLFDNVGLRTMLDKVVAEKIEFDNFEISVNLLPYGESVLLLNAKYVTNETSKEQLILLAIEDITERRLAETRLQVLAAGFESKVQERTHALRKTNKELKSTVKDLNNANIQLQEYAYIASHDLQEPLRKISMFISQLKNLEDAPDEAKAAELIEKISKSAVRMNALIKDLLAYSYIGNHEKQFVATDLNVIIKNILADFELVIEEHNVTLEVGEMPCISAIPLQMNQLFYNLISNALKFHKNDGTLHVVSITASQLDRTIIESYQILDPLMTYFEIVIKDNGIGFDKQYEKRIFTIFQRLHNQDVYTGTGIGLAIGKKIVDNHKGIIFAKADENVGAEFHIILPLW